jgi:hypothetical protein
MNRAFPFLSLLLAAALAPAACSKTAGDNACALASACFGDTGSSFAQTCVLFGAYTGVDRSLLSPEEQLYAAAYDCISAASDCTAAKACLGADATQAATCKTGSAHCSGSVLVDCHEKLPDGTPQAFDCGAAGLVCVETAGDAACGTAKCDPSTTKPSCDGTRAVRCTSPGVLVGGDCSLTFGEDCSSDGTTTKCSVHVADACAMVDGSPSCVGSGAACNADTFEDRCDGSVIVGCSGGKEARFDCNTMRAGLTCKIGSNGAATCGGTGTECDGHTDESCKDGVVTYCDVDHLATVDCKAAGLSGCATSTEGGQTTARCVQ